MKVLAIGAHPDDVEIGCGGALLAHRKAGDDLTVLVMSDGNDGRGSNCRVGEQEDAASLLGAELLWGGFQDGSVPEGKESIDVIEMALARSGADIVYTHSLADTHQDHRATAAAAVGASRKVARSPLRVADDARLHAELLRQHRPSRRGQARPHPLPHLPGDQERHRRPRGRRGTGPLQGVLGPGTPSRGLRGAPLPARPGVLRPRGERPAGRGGRADRLRRRRSVA